MPPGGMWFFRTAHPDETIFYHPFRDSAFFPKYDKVRDLAHFNTFIEMVRLFKKAYPALDRINQDLLWYHVLTSTIMYTKYIAEGALPNDQETEDTIFQLLTTGLSACLKRMYHKAQPSIPGKQIFAYRGAKISPLPTIPAVIQGECHNGKNSDCR